MDSKDPNDPIDLKGRLALIVDDFSSTLLGLRLLPQVSREAERLRLLCLPVFASFFSGYSRHCERTRP